MHYYPSIYSLPPTHTIAFVVDNTRGNTLTIIDMTDHTNPEIIGSETYNAAGYTHQGWLSEDQTHLFLDGKFLHLECMLYLLQNLLRKKCINFALYVAECMQMKQTNAGLCQLATHAR